MCTLYFICTKRSDRVVHNFGLFGFYSVYILLNHKRFLELLFILVSPLLPAILAQPHITLSGSKISSYFFGCCNLKNKVSIFSIASAYWPLPFCGPDGCSCLKVLPSALFHCICALHLFTYFLFSTYWL